MAYPENSYPADPDLPAASNQVTFDVNLWNVITSYLTDIAATMAGISDQNGNINLYSGQYIAWVETSEQIAGRGGISIDCNGLYSAVAADNTILQVTTEDLCFSAWINLDADSAGVEAIIAKRSTVDSRGYFFGIDDTSFGGADGVLVCYVKDDADSYCLTGNTDLRDGAWHHVAAIIDKSAAATCKLYLDGEEDGATNKAGTITDVGSITNTTIMSLGKGSYAGRIFDGQIADVKMYYAAGAIWTEPEVQRQYENPYNRTSAVVGTLTDAWYCDENTGTTLAGKTNDLTLSDILAWSTTGPATVVQADHITVAGDISLASIKALGAVTASEASTAGTVTIGGNLTASSNIVVTTISETKIEIEQIATPANPEKNNAYLWNDDGAGAHDVGDIMVVITHGSDTRTKKLVDFA